MSTTQDSLGVDPRTRDTRPPADNSSNDNNSPPFDGVLADVGSGANKTDAAPKKADTTTPETTPTPATAAAATSDPTMLDALIGLLGKGTGVAGATDTTADPKADSSKGDETGSDLVDSLLKKMTSKDSAPAAAQPPGGAVPTAMPSDMMSMLMMGSGINPATQSTQADGGDAEKGSNTSALAAAATASSGDLAAPTDTKVAIVSDLSVSTHLAPVDPFQNKTLATGPKTPATPGLVDATTAAGSDTAHARGEAETGAAIHNTDLAVTAPNLAGISQDLGPVRSIATALGALAAENAPAAAATPQDMPKPGTLGVARTMTLQLNPADLGTVAIRMHVTGTTLDVQLSISDPQTLGMVSRERNTLSSALQDQNYQLNSLVIQDGGAAASSGGNNAATQGDTSGSNTRSDRYSGGGDTGNGSDSSGSGRQGQSADRSTRDSRQPTGDATPRPAVDSRGTSLFV